MIEVKKSRAQMIKVAHLNVLERDIKNLTEQRNLLISCGLDKEALAIYGVGGTIDYIKSNDKAEQIPDKAVDALIKWLDTEQEDEKGGEQ